MKLKTVQGRDREEDKTKTWRKESFISRLVMTKLRRCTVYIKTSEIIQRWQWNFTTFFIHL